MAKIPRKVSEALAGKLVGMLKIARSGTSTHPRTVDQSGQLLGFDSTSMKPTSSQTSSRFSRGAGFSFPKRKEDPGDSTNTEGEYRGSSGELGEWMESRGENPGENWSRDDLRFQLRTGFVLE